MKRSKYPVKPSASKNDDVNIIVLPPNLLKKLGINFGNIAYQTDQLTNQTDNSVVGHASEENGQDIRDGDESSILETANLMKESVLLSPSFVPICNGSPNKINLSNATHEDISISDGNSLFSNNVENEFDVGLKKIIDDECPNYNVTQLEDVTVKDTSYYDNPSGNVTLICNRDEDILPDYSHFTCETDLEINENLKAASKELKPNNKIEIISEKIIKNKNMNVVKKKGNKKSNCFYVPINTIVKGKATNNNIFCNNIVQKAGQDKNCTEIKLNMKVGDENRQDFSENNLTTDEISHNKDLHNSKDQTLLSTTIEAYTETVEKEQPTIRAEGDDFRFDPSLQSQNNNFECDQFTNETDFTNNDNKSKYVTANYKDKTSTMDEKTVEKLSKTKNKPNTKLCIQGVEKPGGVNESSTNAVLRTYKKTTTNKRNPEIDQMGQIDFSKIVDSNQLSQEIVKEMNDKSITEYQSCICKDFGQMVNYDMENDKHIHFCNSNDVRCNLETLFSIYDDSSIPRKSQITDDVEDFDEADSFEKVQNNICWLSIACVDENSEEIEGNSDQEVDEVAFSQSKISEKLNPTVKQYTRKSTRKRKSDADKCEPKAKKSTKCGVCGQNVPEANWNKHIHSEHNLIAWKDCETIVEESSPKYAGNKSPKLTSTRRSSRLGGLDVSVSQKNVSLPKLGHSTDQMTVQKRPEDPKAKSNQMFIKTKTDTANAQKDEHVSAKSKRKSSIETSKICTVKNVDVETVTNSKESLNVNSSKSTRSSKKSIDVEDSVIALRKSKDFDPFKSAAIPTNLNGKEVEDLNKSKRISTESEVSSNKRKSLIVMVPNKVTRKTKDVTVEKDVSISRTIKKENDIADTPSKLKNQNRKLTEINIFGQSASSTPKDSNKDSRHIKGKNSSKASKKTVDVDVISSKSKDSTNDNDFSTQTKKSITVNETPRVVNSSISKTLDAPSSKVTRSSKNTSTSNLKSADTPVTSKAKKSKTLQLEIVGVAESSKYVEIEVSLSNSEKAVSDRNTSNARDNSELHRNSNEGNSNSAQNSVADKSQEGPGYPEISIKEEVAPKCDVCKQDVEESQWIEHICKEHDYLAWRQGETPLDLENDVAIHDHLHAIVKAHGMLTCSKCGLERKYVRTYLKHLRTCDHNVEIPNQDVSTDLDMSQNPDVAIQGLDDSPLSTYSRQNALIRNPMRTQLMIICGVCNEEVKEKDWIEHIRIEHNYMAWKGHEKPLNLDDEAEVKIHLQNISKYHGGLICHKCGTIRSYVKKYLDHVNSCNGEPSNISLLDNTINNSNVSDTSVEPEILPEIVKCGKCSLDVRSSMWVEHIQGHKYLSWIDGNNPVDENDKEAVHRHLLTMIARYGELICMMCGTSRKSPRAYLDHVNACEVSGYDRRASFVPRSHHVKPDQYECARCLEVGDLKKWREHAMNKHYNVTWMTGEQPLNIRNNYAVEKLLKDYHKKNSTLVCKECGVSRVSVYGFYAHILVCGKSPEETAALHEICNICNKKYLCIYRNQHKAMHREQEYKNKAKELKVAKEAEQREMEKTEVSGKRRAAQKAKKDMEKYTSNIEVDGSHQCQSCHISYDTEKELKEHPCPKDGNASDSDVSIKLEEESDDDAIEIDSDISDEENDPTRKRKRHSEPLPKITLPYKVKNCNYYLASNYEDLCELHYTSDCLFNDWRQDEYEIILEEASSRYMPALTESCKIRSGNDEWKTMKRFEAHKSKDITLFVGASIRCMQWAPTHMVAENDDQYLAVSCFAEADCPRFEVDELWSHPGMLQIWNIKKFLSIPKLEVGLVHEYGTVWAMDWCPSGTRDTASDKNIRGVARLGLLAVACSNGGAYIFAIPRFFVEEDAPPKICKIKPVAELRFSSWPGRQRYQATSISWSPQKGHNIVMVGYSDGTIALYDLTLETPWCKAVENGIDVFYPFEDKRMENSSITGIALSASADPRHLFGEASSASVTGASMYSWSSVVPVVRSHLAASGLLVTPHWPAALLCSDDIGMKSANEMCWWGGGRRVGGACAGAACARCSRLCLTAPPFVRVLRAHPAYTDIKKQIVATMKMVPLAKKRKHQQDELATIVEPVTYDETVKKYGLEFKTIPKKNQNIACKLADTIEQCPERFPLSDMPAVAFCPARDYHSRLALASHAGFVFIISV